MNETYIDIKRIAEIKGLKSTRSIRIAIHKGKYIAREIKVNGGTSLRKLKINNKITEILKRKFNKTKPDPTDFVFKFDSPLHPQQYIEEVVLKGLSKELGIPKLYTSDLQHNFTNLCLNQNIPVTYIQKSLGYYGIVTFVKTYKNLIEKREKIFYNPLEKLKCV